MFSRRMMFSAVVLLFFVFNILTSAFNIHQVESTLAAQTLGTSVRGSASDDQVGQHGSLSYITSPGFSDRSASEISKSDSLEEDFKFGKICINQYLLYKAWRVFDPYKLPKEYVLPSEKSQLYTRSGTLVIQEIKENWRNLDPETQNALGFVFKRPTDSGGGIDGKRHLLPKLYNTTNFVIHWTNGTDGGSLADAVPLKDANINGIPDYVEDFAAIFEYVRSFEIGSRGFHAPPNDSALSDDANRRNPDQRYDIFIYNMSAYGYTNAERWPISPSYSFIGVDNDYIGFSTTGLQAMQITAAHEFFHAIQFYYDCIESDWWMEATATYMEDEAYPDVNANYRFLPYWFECCDLLGLETFDELHEYGSFIFAKRLSEDFGDNVIREIWEEMILYDGINAIDNVLFRRGLSFLEEFNWFTIANFFLEDTYVDGTDYRKYLTGNTTFNGVWLEYQYNASFEPDYVVIDAKNVNGNAWMDRWATDYVTIKLDPTIRKYRIFFDGLDLTTNYLVTIAFKKNGVVSIGTGPSRFLLDAQKDDYVDLSYDPTVENLTLIISNAGNTATAKPSWRVIITKLFPHMELYYDDGTDEKSWRWPASGCMFAVRFTPTKSGRLIECSFYIRSDLAPVKVHVMDRYRNELIKPFLKTPVYVGWIHVDLTKFEIAVSQNVDFYIAIETTVANAPALGSDTSNPDGRSWDYDGTWTPFPSEDYMMRAIVATETPDLTISNISWSPSTPVEGNTVTFTVSIKNRGPVNAGAFKVSYYIDGSKIGEWSISGLSAGQNVTKSFTWTAVLGNHTVKAFADSSYNVEEQVEINNQREEAFQVIPKPKPDLIVSNISWNPLSPSEGDTVTFAVIIKNNGTLNAGSFKTSYYVDGTKLGEWSISSLPAGQTVSRNFTWTAIKGDHTVEAFADSSYNIDESNENNNRRQASLTISGKADLIISDISWTPISPKEGETLNFTVYIHNQGTETASSFMVAYYIDGVKLGEWFISSLSAGQSITRTFNWTAVNGTHTVKAFADSNYNISEKDENNNQKEKTFSVSPIHISSNYAFTSDIYGSIVVTADNIVIDGKGYALQGPGYGTGIFLNGRTNVTIKNIVVKGFDIGIWLYYSHSNVLGGNNITGNRYGMWLDYSSGNILRRNHMANNVQNFGVIGILLERDFINDIDSSNTVNGKPIYYLVNQRGLVIDSFTSPPPGYVALINSSDIIVKDLTLTNNMQGILLAYTTNSTITKVNATNNWAGIDILFSNNNRIAENYLSNNSGGIRWALGSSRNIFSDNHIISNYLGFTLFSEGNNTLRRNSMINNTLGFSIVSAIGYDGQGWPDSLSDFINDIDASNTINGKPIYYLINQENLTIDPSTFPDIGYLALINSTNITIKDLTITEEIVFAYTSNSTITNVNASHAPFVGIWLFCSNSNVISNSIISHKFASGIWIRASSDNTISGNLISNNGAGLEYSRGQTGPVINNVVYHNNFINNTRQVWVRDVPPEEQATNKWYHPVLLEGNYWSDYTDVDMYSGPYQNETGSDGIWDHPYIIDANNQDNYPLTNPWSPFLLADLNRDGKVNIMDVYIIAKAFGSKLGDPNWNPIADLNNDKAVNIMDIFIMAREFGKKREITTG